MDIMNLELFMSLFFDEDTQEQFFKECEELGIIEDEEETDMVD